MSFYVYLQEFDQRERLIANVPVGRQLDTLEACIALIASREGLLLEPGQDHQFMILEVLKGKARYCLLKEK